MSNLTVVKEEQKSIQKSDNLDTQMKQIQVSLERMNLLTGLSEKIFKSGLAPHYFKNPESIFIAMEYGMTSFGMTPMSSLLNIQVIQGKPGPSAAAAVGSCLPLLDRPPKYEYFDNEGNKTGPADTNNIFRVTCTMVRGEQEFEGTFSLDDAKRAGLFRSGGGWEKYPSKMLEARAGMFAARLSCQDKMAGVYSAEEIRDFDDPDKAQTSAAIAYNTADPQGKSKLLKEKLDNTVEEIEEDSPEEDTEEVVQVQYEDIIKALNHAFSTCENPELNNQVLMALESETTLETEEAISLFAEEYPENQEIISDLVKRNKPEWKKSLDTDEWKQLVKYTTKLKKYFKGGLKDAA